MTVQRQKDQEPESGDGLCDSETAMQLPRVCVCVCVCVKHCTVCGILLPCPGKKPRSTAVNVQALTIGPPGNSCWLSAVQRTKQSKPHTSRFLKIPAQESGSLQCFKTQLIL